MKPALRALAALHLCFLAAAASPALQQPVVRTSDVDRFYALYNSTNGKPSAEQLQAYVDGSTDGFLTFARIRSIDGQRIAQAMEKRPEIYAEAKKCSAVLPSARVRLASALARLKEIYPEASLPPVTIAVGRGKPVGTADASGVMIGLEALCATSFMNPDVEDRFVYVIAHEYVHVQQSRFFHEDPEEKVLKASLLEGGAEFIGELISGSVSYKHLPLATKGREKEFEAAFLADIDKAAVGSAWLYNHPGTAERPADLGYWIGYRIARLYYLNADDKQEAIRDIIELRDPKDLLVRSGWEPGLIY